MTATYVPCDAAQFERVALFNCDRAPMQKTLQGCAVLRLGFADGGAVHIAHRYMQPGVVELVAVQGAAKRGSVLDYLPWLESRTKGHALRLVTQRPGLIRKLSRHGYTERGAKHPVGTIMQKDFHGRR